MDSKDIFDSLSHVIEGRKGADPDSSYVASLYSSGLNKILEKVGEETTEVIISAKDAQTSGDTSGLVCEMADLWFHCMVALSHFEVKPEAVLEELGRRFDVSGLEEKASRK